MKYFSPSRPSRHGKPLYLTPTDAEVAPIPNPLLCPTEEGGWTIAFFLMRDKTTATYFSKEVSPAELPTVLARFLDDPEGFFHELGWEYTRGEAVAQKTQSQLSFDDLFSGA